MLNSSAIVNSIFADLVYALEEHFTIGLNHLAPLSLWLKTPLFEKKFTVAQHKN